MQHGCFGRPSWLRLNSGRSAVRRWWEGRALFIPLWRQRRPGDELSADGAGRQPSVSAAARPEKSPLTLSEASIEGCWLDTQWTTSLPPYPHWTTSCTRYRFAASFFFFFGFCRYLALSSLNGHTNVGADIAAVFFYSFVVVVFFFLSFLSTFSSSPHRNSMAQELTNKKLFTTR